MEFQEVVRRRRMIRRFTDKPIDPEVRDRILANAHQAPSAGFTQGYAFLVLEGSDQTGRFWEAAGAGAGETVRAAPLVVLPLSSKRAYLDRYAEPDKGWTDRDESRWPAPFWDVDAAFASMLMLLTVVDEGLGALFFGLEPESLAAVRAAFGIPGDHTPIGAVAIGHRLPDPVIGSAATRPRRPLDQVVHRGHW